MFNAGIACVTRVVFDDGVLRDSCVICLVYIDSGIADIGVSGFDLFVLFLVRRISIGKLFFPVDDAIFFTRVGVL